MLFAREKGMAIPLAPACRMPPVNAHAVLGEPFLEDVAANWTSRKLRVTVFPATANLAKQGMHSHSFVRAIPRR